ncbi:homoserine kinase [Spirulina sp. CS-785/01]|uniref:homoserine kinase n=1 Tax=Spirulina sp. CS-785/01 TaxID=3021716 RepID=UPI00232CD7CE|nr:homoserine kinase [Spirulina sp. CS-785/01]MDB9312307.1 homoserine kinase [Spirulina sp. CS-785/01]
MPLISSVIVPATTANLGPGFDCIGAALSIYNQFEFVCSEEPIPEGFKIHVPGSQGAKVSKDEDNLVYQSFCYLYEQLEQTPPSVEIKIQMSIPLERGLGSSATAIIGGLLGANQLAGTPLNTQEILQLAIAIEGHPDNIVPALLGGCRLAVANPQPQREEWQICEIPWHQSLVPIVAVPNFTLSTAQARSVLPPEVSRSDAIFNASRLALLVKALETGDTRQLSLALQDKIHQPYRQLLIPGYQMVRLAALEAGACELVISGAGPTLLAIAKYNIAQEVANAMQEAWTAEGITTQVRPLHLDKQGARSRREMVSRRRTR